MAPREWSEVNVMRQEEFVDLFGGVWEVSPWVAREAWAMRPFAEREALWRAMTDAVQRAGPERQVELIRAHPELAGRLARAGMLSAASAAEQSATRLDALTADEAERFDRLNAKYRERFGFPFVMCVRLSEKAAILEAFERRLRNGVDAERRAAIEEIGKIAALRLEELVVEQEEKFNHRESR
jgi:OHCU decarboxylase